MNVLHGIVRVHIPELLASVPIPETFSGLFSLSRYSVYFTMKNRYFSKHVNTLIKKDQEKVVDFIDIESIGRKAVYCRCWKSKKFPLCDGAHNAHNAETGDNVGPLIIEAKKSA
ncbi:CDGSH iron-sulfur domain-containing protein 2 -like protein A [Echinococcus granulosus]|nr:CDGSH iron-sulfur domain-containing protein 2 -like protein A [Echinococcus granulosus]